LLDEAGTRTKLIDPALYERGWTEDLIKCEETLGIVEIIGGQARRQTHKTRPTSSIGSASV
jgi:type I restriction enzyme R subunit